MHKSLLPIAALALLSACAQPQTYQAALSGSQQVPPTSAQGTGTFQANYQPDTKAFTYTVNYSGLTGPLTGAHIHAPAGPGANAPVAIPFANSPSPITGGATLTDAQEQALMTGQAYVNLHTAANPGGEIRGQIARVR